MMMSRVKAVSRRVGQLTSISKTYFNTVDEVPPHTPFFKYNLWRPIAIRGYL